MLAFILKRLGAMVLILLVLSATVFLLQSVSPLDAVHAQLGANASQAAVAAARRSLGLDQPLIVQYWHYLGGLVTGNLGTSYRTRDPITQDIATYFPATLELTIAGIVLALILAAVFAFGAILRWPGNKLFQALLLIGSSSPVFLLGIAGIIVFYEILGWLPAAGRTDILNAPVGPTGLLTIDGVLHGRLDVTVDAIRHLVLPGLAIAIGPAVAIGRVLRSSMAADLSSDYARTSRARGLTEFAILFRHVFRNTLGAALSMTGLQIGLMFAGVLVVEQVFGWPGIGQYVAQSIPVADFPAIAGVTLLLGAIYVVINALVDVFQAIADPRIKL